MKQVARGVVVGTFAIVLTAASVGSAGSGSPSPVQLAKLRASEGGMDDRFGGSVAISGKTMVVGAPGAGAGGAVYVFKRPRDGWANGTENATLTASDAADDDGFGAAVAIDGDTIVVGAPFDGNGSAYVFERPPDGWKDATEDGKLTPADNLAFNFGDSVAVSGNSALIGAPLATVGGDGWRGAAYVFLRHVDGWVTSTEDAKLTVASGTDEDFFGRSVGISGDTTVIGAPGRNVAGNTPNRGIAYIFVAPAGPNTWLNDDTPNASLVASEGATNDFFGFAVGISGPTVVAGAMQDDVEANGTQGSAYVFERPLTGWVDAIESTKLLASDGAAFDRLGNSAAVSGDTIVLGAPTHNVGTESDQGAAYLYSKPAAGWVSGTPRTQSAKLVAKDGLAGDHLGGSVSISNGIVAAGAGADDFGTATERGSAYVFGAPQRSRISLKVATSERRIKARGRIRPPQPRERVIVTLLRKQDGRFRTLAVKRPRQSAAGRYRSSFGRPNAGDCKIRARYPGNAATQQSRAVKRFAC